MLIEKKKLLLIFTYSIYISRKRESEFTKKLWSNIRDITISKKLIACDFCLYIKWFTLDLLIILYTLSAICHIIDYLEN